MFDLQPIKNDLYIEGFHSIYYFEFSKDFFHDPEQHPFWEMVYVDSGTINAITNGIGCMLSQGQVIFHEPMEIHAHISDRQTANSMLVVSFTCDSEMMQYLKGKTFTLDKTSKTLLTLFLEEAKNALGTIPSDYQNKENLSFSSSVFGAPQLLQAHFTEFLIKLIRAGGSLSSHVLSSKQSRDMANNSLCELMCEYMKRNVYDSLTLKQLCDHFFLGKTQLCKFFHEWTGQSPMEYYMSQKIAESKKLLREKRYSVTQISDMLGYSSIHNFSRAFKKATGFSPTGYLKRIL
jgi:AraC-like DNA-binding protein